MKFRNRGPLRRDDVFKYRETILEITNNYCYLGVTFQTTGTTFTIHIERRINKAISEIYRLNDLKLLSISSALKLFYLKISPIIEYCFSSIFEHLTTSNLHRVDFILFTFLKIICTVSSNSRNRLLLLICDTPTLINVLIKKYNLPETEPYKQYLQNLTEKLSQVEGDFFETPAMTQERWKEPLNENRHIITRHAMHGFHHKICGNKTFHTANDTCTCILCGLKANQYHLLTCTANTTPLREFAENVV